MNWDAIGAIAELIGSVAVLATLVYVAIQVRQARSLLQSTAHQARADRNIDIAHQLLNNPEWLALMLSDPSPSDLDPVETTKVRYLYSIFMRHNEDLHFQYELGQIDEETWNAALTSLKTMGTKNQIAFWKQMEGTFRKPFRDLIDEHLGT